MISCCRFDIRNGVGVVKDGGSVFEFFVYLIIVL